MKRLILLLSCILIQSGLTAQAGKDGTLTVSSTTQIVNQYSPLSASLTAGDNTLSIASTSIISLCAGDLIMIYQAQGVSITSTNSALYGDITAYNSAGLYEFKYVQSVSGNVITTQTTFTNSYALGGRPQVIRVPQYSTLTINPGASIVPKPWKDTVISLVPYRIGGLVVIHSTNIVNNGTISASGVGFRGGSQNLNSSYPYTLTTYVSTSMGDGGEKGESVFGNGADYDLNGGRYCRGAAANGGGGGTSVNSSGGGGANAFNSNTWNGQGVMIVNANNLLSAWALDPGYVANSNALTNSSGGGRGGYSWGAASLSPTVTSPGSLTWLGDTRREVGGMGGRPLTNINPETRIYFGGGGGAGHANNLATGTAGSNGGGIVYIIATTGVTGAGAIISNGLSAASSTACPNGCDGVGGAGAGGSVVIKTNAIASTQTVSAVGGKGASQQVAAVTLAPTYESEGAGGGGGGGFAAISATGVIPLISGGANGTVVASFMANMNSNGATQGASGQTISVTPGFITYTATPSLPVSTNTSVCTGATISFTSPAALAYQWSGPNGFSSSLQNPSIQNATALMSGTYLLSYTAGCTGVQTQTNVVSINPTPTLVTGNQSVCIGSSATLTASGANTYSWSPSSASGNTLLVTPVNTVVYTVTGTSSAGCSAANTLTLYVNANPNVSISASSSSACAGSSVNLFALASMGYFPITYTWTNGPTTPNYSTTRPPGTYTFTVTISDGNNCQAVATASLTFVGQPTVSVPNISVCPGFAGTLTALGATSYTWKPGNFAVNPFVATPPVTTQYTVTGSAAGCTANATASIIVKPVPAFSFVTATITCANLGSATVTASGTNGPYSYSWTPTNQTGAVANNLYPATYSVSAFDNSTGCTSNTVTTFSSLVPFTGTVSATPSVVCAGDMTGTASVVTSGGSGAQNYLWNSPGGSQTAATATNLGAGTHTVTITDAVTFCTVTQNFLITQPQPFSINIAASGSMACVGSSINLAALGSGGTVLTPGAYSYTWAGGGPNSIINNVTQNTGNTYTYSVDGTDANNCTASASIALLFVDYPVLSANDATVCSGSAVNLTVSGAQAYSWYPGGFTGSSLFITPTANTTYSITGNTLGCTSTTVVAVFINPLPDPVIISSNNVCETNPINLNTSAAGTCTWSGPANFTSTLQANQISNVTLNNSGTYSLTVTDLNGCSASNSTLVTVFPNPVAAAKGASVCAGESATLSATGGLTYLWNGPNGYVSIQASAVVQVANIVSAGLYTVYVYGSLCVTPAIADLVVYDYPLPSPTINATSKTCLFSDIKLSGQGGGTYTWKGPAGFTSQDQNLSFVAQNLNMSGIYTLTVKNASNCSASATVPVMVYPLPTATVLADHNQSCAPLCVDFSFLQGNNIAPVVKTNLKIEGIFSTDSVFRFCVQPSGIHQVNAFFTDTNGCVSTSTLQLDVYPKPTADFEFSPQKPVENIDEVIFTNTSSGYLLNKFAWHFNQDEGPVADTKDAALLYEKPGTYPVAMIVTNLWGCSDTIVKPVVIYEDFSIYVPNAFTPNDDDKNDVFQPKGVGIASYRIEVFNRWGEKVYSGNDINKGWDGRFKGLYCTNDVYSWNIIISSHDGKTKNLTGHVTLLD